MHPEKITQSKIRAQIFGFAITPPLFSVVKQRQRTPQQSCGASKALPHQDRNRSADISLRHISCTYPRCRAAGYHDEMKALTKKSFWPKKKSFCDGISFLIRIG